MEHRPFHLTRRDKEIIRAVYQYRALSAPQIGTLFFPPAFVKGAPATNSRCRYRLKLLHVAEYLARVEQPQILSEGRKPFVYFLAKKGAQLLATWLDCALEDLDFKESESRLSFQFLEHFLLTNDVRVALHLAAARSGAQIERWDDELTLRRMQMKEQIVITNAEGAQQKVSLIPDGYFRLHTSEPEAHVYHHFVEIDRRTETGESSVWGRRDWARKVKAYLMYFDSGQYEQRYGTKKGRLLTVTTGERRLTHLKELTEQLGGKSRFWFSTFDHITPEAVLRDEIWQVAGREGASRLIW
jgi:Replication-relaxation